MAQKLKMVSLKVEPRQKENLITISNINDKSQSELLRNWIDKELEKNILDIVSEAGKEIEFRANPNNDYTTIEEEIESSDLVFTLSIEVAHKYYPPEEDCDNAYEFEVLSYKVTLVEINDENGVVEVNKKLEKQIEKGFNKNLTFNILKTY